MKICGIGMSQEYKGQVYAKNNEKKGVVGLPGIEPGTSRLSGVRSNRLSYKPTRNILKRRMLAKTHLRFLCQKALLIIHPKSGFVKLIC